MNWREVNGMRCENSIRGKVQQRKGQANGKKLKKEYKGKERQIETCRLSESMNWGEREGEGDAEKYWLSCLACCGQGW